MKYIDRHRPISLTRKDGSIVTGSRCSNEEFFTRYHLNDALFSKGIKSIKAGISIKAAYRGNSAQIALDDYEYLLLKAAVENPEQIAGQPMSAEMARQFLPFLEMVMGASDEPRKAEPAKKEKPAKKAKGKGKAKQDTSPADARMDN